MLRRRTYLALLTGGFLAGCLPTARLVASASGVRIEEVGTGNPGAANVRRSLGARSGAIVLAGDAAKGAVPVLAGRLLGAGESQLGALSFAPVLGHVTVVRGRGVAAALGAIIVVDPPAIAIVSPIFLLGSYRGAHAPSVLITYLVYPLVRRLVLGRSRTSALWSAGLMGFLALVRLRGSLGSLARGRLDRGMLWERLVHDRAPAEADGR